MISFAKTGSGQAQHETSVFEWRNGFVCFCRASSVNFNFEHFSCSFDAGKGIAHLPDIAKVRKKVSFSHFLFKNAENDHFTKTGSGQT